ncbi:MAG: hypothetical protein KME59_22840 [Trichormus sp. ATA11-4-KO1]|jgi:prefoldin subunit 5|nr:hypothetical protein [Trichormus sp. ATA11-4-KO1]
MNNDSNVNGNPHNSHPSTANSVELSELGEVKTALGRLYKEFESFKQLQKTERERDRAELQAWAQTNLIQNQLLSKAMVTIEMLTGELKNQNLSWNEYEQNNENLRQELTLLLSQSQSISESSTTLESLEFKGLKSEISELKSNWNELVLHTNRLTTVIQELKQNPPQNPTREKEVLHVEPLGSGCFMALGTGFAFLVLFFLVNLLIPVRISNDIDTYLRAIWQRTRWSNTKLERVEKHLGTDPNQKK